ncbi:MAG: hypothetical protein NC489_30675 [Ruminococcus flavefaciens]|nr:hypothetical protein [Ruminococcus flavefaciens]
MKEWTIVIAKHYTGEEYEFPDTYRAHSDSEEGAAAILEEMYRSYLAIEEQETSIPIDHERTYCNAEAGYAQIAWENGDTHQYFLTEAQDADQYLDETIQYLEGIQAALGKEAGA